MQEASCGSLRSLTAASICCCFYLSPAGVTNPACAARPVLLLLLVVARPHVRLAQSSRLLTDRHEATADQLPRLLAAEGATPRLASVDSSRMVTALHNRAEESGTRTAQTRLLHLPRPESGAPDP